MKKVIAIFLFLGLIIPSFSLAQGDLFEKIENNIDTQEISNTDSSDVVSLTTRFLNVFNDLFSMVQNLLSNVNDLLISTVGISITELIKVLFVATINILEVILELLGSILNYV